MSIVKKIKNKIVTYSPSKIFLGRIYKMNFGKKINWSSPETYNEKLQWLKVYYRNSEYTGLVDKFNVREYVKEKIGQEYLIPLIGVWDNVYDIQFDDIPDKFVMKCTHDSGGVYICNNKKDMGLDSLLSKFDNLMKHNYYLSNREWPYRFIQPRILIEKKIEQKNNDSLIDYKFFCFDGVVEYLFVATDRNKESEEVKFDFFDKKFNYINLKNGHPNSIKQPEKPENYETMIELAEKLSSGIPHVRVDFYNIDGVIYFGEMTFFHHSGFVPFEPERFDYILGSCLNLPPKSSLWARLTGEN